MKQSGRATLFATLALLGGFVFQAACVSDDGLADAKCATVCSGVCVDVQSDDAHCGACGNACAANARCEAGECKTIDTPDSGPVATATCAAGSSLCGDGCTPTSIDPANCGRCGHACANGETCQAGVCACPAAAPDTCSAVCTNTHGDALNCGACGTACATGLTCVAGACDVTSAPPLALSLLAGALGSEGNLDGTATASRLGGPTAVCADGGAAYVFENDNCTVRKVDLTTFATSTVAGTSGACATGDGIGASARLFAPRACVGDGAGTIYFVDAGSCALRSLDTSTLAVTTIAGGVGCGNGSSSPQGIALDATNGVLYVADAASSSIRRVVVASGSTSLVAGSASGQTGADDGKATNARFSGPTGIVFDANANALYVADTNNHTIRLVTLGMNPSVSTIAGTAGTSGYLDNTGKAALFASPTGLATDGAGKLYVTEAGNHDVRAVSLTDFSTSTVAGAPTVSGYADGRGTGALFSSPHGIAIDATGSVFVADFGNHALREVDLATSTVTTRAGLGAARGSANGVGAAATFDFPWSVVAGAGTTLYVSDYTNSVIRTVDSATGAVDILAGTPGAFGNVDGTGTATRWSNPTALAFDGQSTLYVADRGNHTIRQIATATKTVTTIAGAPGNAGYADGANPLFNAPVALAVGSGADANSLFVADASQTVRALDLTTHATTLIAGKAGDARVVDGVADTARFSQIVSLAYRNGVVYVGDASRIRALDLSTKRVTTLSGAAGYADGVGGFASFDFAVASTSYGQVSVDADGTLLVADFGNGVLRRFDPTALAATTLAGIRGRFGALPAPLPTSIATSPRSVIPIKGGYVFAANDGLFVLR